MKKLAAFLMMVLLVCTQGCTPEPEFDDNKINVVCTVFPQYDFLREIAKDKINLTMLLPPGGEAHSYEPTPGDIIALNNADLFVAIGGESEHWALHLIEGEGTKDIPTLLLIDEVAKLTQEHTEGAKNTTHSHEHIHTEECMHHTKDTTEYDEHIWTSPENCVVICKRLCEMLSTIDPKNKDFYKANTSGYISRLKKLNTEYCNAVSSAARDTVVFGDRFPMRYLTEDMKLKYFAAFPGCSSKTEPSVETVIFLANKVKSQQIPVVFYMDYGDGRIAKAIANECNAKAMRLYSCHNLSQKDFENGETYLSLMYKNLNSLKEALN